ncbi:hypothetical protein [Gordonia rubripertincta]|uniref:Uncharacterized protein n=1 Tax=Gordonia rubripertincta TaxID=36822 RepID=A0ABT4MSH6_GORRU|nr:hypothetical protein [Gordonia rubripertincta]MCZ4549774.1 hypothetical protein [Gordonia rubripertincta]
MSYDVLATDDDLSARPQEYPGRPVPGIGTLHHGRFWTAVDHADLSAGLRRHRLADLAGRTAVLAIGSNACAAVVLRKLESVGVDSAVPFLAGVATGISVGHSAHRSVSGFIPAAPFASAGTRNSFIVTMFSGDQLAAIDATEPNYRRITVECDLPGRESAELYVSRWGVIAPPGEQVLPLMSQEVLFGRLSEQCQGFRQAHADVNTGMVAELFIERGWARDPGLG